MRECPVTFCIREVNLGFYLLGSDPCKTIRVENQRLQSLQKRKSWNVGVHLTSKDSCFHFILRLSFSPFSCQWDDFLKSFFMFYQECFHWERYSGHLIHCSARNRACIVFFNPPINPISWIRSRYVWLQNKTINNILM